MKKLFTAIRNGDIDTVKELLAKKPELLSCTAKQPPKKDDGQSPLQVAIKSGNFKIADYLLDSGADVNFMEAESCNDWKMPVIQDAIMAAVLNSRFTRSWDGVNWEFCHTKVQADTAYHILKRMMDIGADIKCHDSYGNSCLMRAILDARQILPSYNHVENKLENNRQINDEIIEDLTRIFDLLLEHGADIHEVDSKSNRPPSERYAMEPVSQFFNK